MVSQVEYKKNLVHPKIPEKVIPMEDDEELHFMKHECAEICHSHTGHVNTHVHYLIDEQIICNIG